MQLLHCKDVKCCFGLNGQCAPWIDVKCDRIHIVSPFIYCFLNDLIISVIQMSHGMKIDNQNLGNLA